jgi:sortase A
MRRGLAFRAVGFVLLGCGALLLGRGAYLEAKAAVATFRIARSFDAHLRDGEAHPPWSWADTHPIARLDVDRLGVRRHVLVGASGTSLAFGVGHVDGTALPNGRGNCVLAGHRDRAFGFLRDLRPGDRIRVRSASGVREYIVEDLDVLSAAALSVLDPTPDDRLTLVTCYPFDGLLRTAWRYVVTCRPAPRVSMARSLMTG